MKVKCLTPGGLLVVQGRTECQAIGVDLQVEVSRGHSSDNDRQGYLGTHGRKAEQTDKLRCNVLSRRSERSPVLGFKERSNRFIWNGGMASDQEETEIGL